MKCRSASAGDWGFEVPGGRRLYFHILEAGVACITTRGASVRLVAPSVALVRPGERHQVRSRTDAPCVSLPDWHRERSQGNLPYASPPRARETRLICGAYSLAPGVAHALFSQFPQILPVSGNAPTARAVYGTIQAVTAEFASDEPGKDAMIAQLLDVMFLQGLRHFASASVERQKLIKALADHAVAKSLTLLSRQIDESWTVARLGRRVGVSRPALARKFSRLLGKGPIRVLTEMRIERAASRLRDSSASLMVIAAEVGFSSDAALSRAFKRVRGISPSVFRAQQRREAGEKWVG